MSIARSFENPFRPGAGHMPPYLAGRTVEQDRFRALLAQDQVITENLVLTGLRGVGKTVLLETLKPIAHEQGWLWTGADMSESASVSEEKLALRLITDLSIVVEGRLRFTTKKEGMGFGAVPQVEEGSVGFAHLLHLYQVTPGLTVDKLKAVLEFVWRSLSTTAAGIVFAYDEAQILSDKSKQREYPLSLLLELFQSVQRKGMRFMLVLTGLPTLFPRLVEARTYSERMFHVLFLSQLGLDESRDAIVRPMSKPGIPFTFEEGTILTIQRLSGGYPYFIQFICREVFESALTKMEGQDELRVPEAAIVAKLDNDFFAARWERATDRERELMVVVASLPNCDEEFTVAEVSSLSQTRLKNSFSPSQVNQMFVRMSDKGLIFKNRHGRYSFAVPLLARFIRRQVSSEGPLGI